MDEVKLDQDQVFVAQQCVEFVGNHWSQFTQWMESLDPDTVITEDQVEELHNRLFS